MEAAGPREGVRSPGGWQGRRELYHAAMHNFRACRL